MASEQTQTPEVSFSSLVLTLSTSAWVALGKIADPLSGEVKQDLPGARYTIDLLVLLRDKTRGNLTPDEDKFLNMVVGELQSNFADVVFEGGEHGEGGGQKSDDQKIAGEHKNEEQGPEERDSREQS